MKKRINFKLIIILSCLIILITMGLTLCLGLDADAVKRGTFGDMFGFANALFTGLSFLGLILTILLQRQDINDQRLDGKIQSFEGTFFNLLNFHRENLNSLEKHYVRNRQSGISISKEEFSKRGVSLIVKIYQQYVESLKYDKNFNKDVYGKVYKLNWDVLGHYYRGIQGLFDFVEGFHIPQYDEYYIKKRYFDIIKSQLSEYETAIIFYHFLFLDNNHYKKVAEKYSFFEFINEELVTDDKILYNNSAF